MKISAHSIDAKKTDRRYRNILANSGMEMESGEIRDLPNLYVMTYDGQLINVNDLNTNPDKQTEEYSVKAQADHGEVDSEGYLNPTIEKQFGSCRVWMEKDGLHARMYFADNDSLADHAFAISEDASYSIGCDWFPEGYEGAGMSIDEPMGILREISMVITGNDPRAKTIDHKPDVTGPTGATEDDGKQTNNKENNMADAIKTADELTRDERDKFVAEAVSEAADAIKAVADKFTADVPESETEPTVKAEAKSDAKEEGETKTETTTDDATLRSPVVVIRDRVAQQPEGCTKVSTTDFKKSAQFDEIVRKSLRENGMSMNGLDSVLRRNLAGKMSTDAITGLAPLSPADQTFVSNFSGADGILQHILYKPVKSDRLNFMSLGEGETGRAHGHRAGDKKINQELTAVNRDLHVKMVYKKQILDTTQLYENPQLLNYTDEEIDDLIESAIEQAIVTGDGRVAPTENAADYRMFDGTNGFWSIKADAANATAPTASTITMTATDNLYTAVVKARGAIKAKGRLVVVTKSDAITTLLTATSNNGFLVQPGVSLETFLQVAAVYAPEWMDDDSNVAYVFAEGQYEMIGERGINHRNSFDADYNGEVRLGETPKAGSLRARKAAVAIAPYTASSN